MLAARNTTVFTSAMASIANQQYRTTQTMQALEVKFSQDTRTIVNALHASNNNTIPGEVISALESSINSYIRHGLQDGFRELHAQERDRLQRRQEEHRQISADATRNEMEDSASLKPAYSTSCATKSAPPRTVTVTPTQRTARNSSFHERFEHVNTRKKFETLFGQVEIALTGTFKYLLRNDLGPMDTPFEYFYRATFAFKPSSWLARPALWRMDMQLGNTKSGYKLSMNPTYNPLVTFTSPAFEACRTANTEMILDLLNTRQLSVNIVDEWGRGLMHVSSSSKVLKCTANQIADGCQVAEHQTHSIAY